MVSGDMPFEGKRVEQRCLIDLSLAHHGRHQARCLSESALLTVHNVRVIQQNPPKADRKASVSCPLLPISVNFDRHVSSDIVRSAAKRAARSMISNRSGCRMRLKTLRYLPLASCLSVFGCTTALDVKPRLHRRFRLPPATVTDKGSTPPATTKAFGPPMATPKDAATGDLQRLATIGHDQLAKC